MDLTVPLSSPNDFALQIGIWTSHFLIWDVNETFRTTTTLFPRIFRKAAEWCSVSFLRWSSDLKQWKQKPFQFLIEADRSFESRDLADIEDDDDINVDGVDTDEDEHRDVEKSCG